MIDRSEFDELLQFKPRWWWDPIPPWIFKELDNRLVLEVLQVQLDLQQAILEQQVQAIGRTREILQQVK